MYFRQGVTSSELSGKTWKVISVPRDSDRSHSSASSNSQQRWSGCPENTHNYGAFSEDHLLGKYAKTENVYWPKKCSVSLSLLPLHSAGRFFCGEVRPQSVASDVESDTEKGSTDGLRCLISSAPPEPLLHAPTDVSGQPIETLKPHLPKVTSDSFISELVSDREPTKTTGESRPASAAVPENEPILGDEEVKEQGAAIPLSQSGGLEDPHWSNVDLAEGQQIQTGAALDTADTCSLSSVATYTLALEDPYGVDEHQMWAWVTGGDCSVDSHTQLSWFNCSVNTSCELNDLKMCRLSCYILCLSKK